MSFSLSFLTGTILVILLKGNYFHLVNVRLFLVLVFVAAIVTLTLRNFRVKFDISTVKNFVINSIPFGLSIIYYNFIQRSNIIILSIMHGTLFSGIFYNGFIFFISLVFIPANLQRVIVPFLYKISFEENRKKYQFAYDIFSKAFCFISFGIMLILFLYSDNFILTIYGEKYRESIDVLRIISFGVPFMFSVAPMVIISLDRQKKNTQILGIATIISTISNLILIYLFKSNGAAISAVITFFSIFIISNYYLSRNHFISVKNLVIYYLAFIFISGVCIFLHYTFLNGIFWIYSIVLILIIYILLVLVVILKKDDIRIIKETLGIKK
jgi:O-antigen/teichoic acid export membrane protein